jgi:hydrogenase nickel incorporation protein HypB
VIEAVIVGLALDFDLERFLYNLDAVHPGVERTLVSAKTGEGIDEWRDWLVRMGSAAAADASASPYPEVRV